MSYSLGLCRMLMSMQEAQWKFHIETLKPSASGHLNYKLTVTHHMSKRPKAQGILQNSTAPSLDTKFCTGRAGKQVDGTPFRTLLLQDVCNPLLSDDCKSVVGAVPRLRTCEHGCSRNEACEYWSMETGTDGSDICSFFPANASIINQNTTWRMDYTAGSCEMLQHEGAAQKYEKTDDGTLSLMMQTWSAPFSPFLLSCQDCRLAPLSATTYLLHVQAVFLQHEQIRKYHRCMGSSE